MNDDLDRACNLVVERTGQVPEVETAEELVGALLEWGDDLALENEQLRLEVKRLSCVSSTNLTGTCIVREMANSD